MRALMPTLSSAVLALALSACGNDQSATQAPAAGAAAPETTSTAPASAPAAASDAPAAAGTDDELVYDPIDVGKLDNQWWRQYSAGG